MQADKELSAPRYGAERFVIRHQRANVLIASPLCIALLALSVGVAGALPPRQRGDIVTLMPFAFVALLALLGFAYFVLGTIWADAERVGSTQLFGGGSCLRKDLVSLRIGGPWSRSGPSCSFVRNDGRDAFQSAAMLWGDDKLRAMAAFLNVPLVDERLKVTHGKVCPVCGFQGLEEPAATNGVGSGEICPGCGFDHGGPVEEQRYRTWRDQWVQQGMPWWAAQAGIPAPKDWDPADQLKSLTEQLTGNRGRIGNIGAERLVLRPVTAIVVALIIPMSLLALACVAAGAALIVSGQVVGLFFIVLAIFTAIAMRALTGARLWADSEQVAISMWQQNGRCARAQLASMRIGPPRTRAGLSCNFVRTDGTVAFRVAAAIWGNLQLASLARFLGVPLVDDTGRPVDR